MKWKLWTPEEDAIIRETYRTHTSAQVALLLGRTVSMVGNRRSILGLNVKRVDGLRDRFEEKVDRLNGPVPPHCPELGRCHMWLGATRTNGYGLIKIKGKMRRAHRVAFFLEHGRWPEPCACHHCDNPTCVNMDHIFEGTLSDNSVDMVRKGRHGQKTHPERTARGDRSGSRVHPERRARGDRSGARVHPERLRRGENHPNAKMTESTVVEYRIAFAGGESIRSIARRTGLSKPTISWAIRRKTWKHVP